MKKDQQAQYHWTRPRATSIGPRVLFSADPVDAGLVQPQAGQVQVIETPEPTQQTSTDELVVIDTRVANYQLLLSDLQKQQSAGRQLDIILINEQDDALSVIDQNLLQSASAFSAIHIVSHGNPGQLQLGKNGLNLEQIQSQAQVLANWSSHLTTNADIRLYGCDFAQGDQGLQAINALASLTGADVAASTDKTGASSLAGNWALEVVSGNQDIAALFTQSTQQQWQDLLSATQGIPTVVENEESTPLVANSAPTSNRLAQNADGALFSAGLIDLANGSKRAEIIFFPQGLDSTRSDFIAPLGQANIDYGGSYQTIDVAVAALDNGQFAVAWVNTTTTPNQFLIAYAIYDQTGALIRNDYITQSASDISYLSIAGSSANQFAVGYLVDGKTNPGTATNQFVFSLQADATTHVTYRSAVPAGYAYSSVAIDYVSGNTYALVVDEMTISHVDSVLRLYAIDTEQLDKDLATGINKDFHAAGPSLATYDVHTHDRSLPILTPQIMSMTGGDIAVFWTEIWREGSGDPFMNIAGSKLKIDANVITAINNVGKSNVTDLSVVDSARFQWDAISQTFTLAYSVPAGIELVKLDSSLEQIAGTTTVILEDQIDRRLYPVGLTMSNNVGQVFYSLVRAAPGVTPPATNPLLYSTLSFAPIKAVIQTPPEAFVDSNVPLLIRLNLQPASDVIVNIDGVPRLTFTAQNWDQPQYIYISTGTPGPVTLEFTVQTGDVSRDSTTELIVDFLAQPHKLVVNTDQDSLDGDTSSITSLIYNPGADGKISLREAIAAANASANGVGIGGTDVIQFAGNYTINLSSQLPDITEAVRIEALDASIRPTVTLNGLNSVNYGLRFTASAAGSYVGGLSIGSFRAAGIFSEASNLTVVGNEIGHSLRGGVYEAMQITGMGINIANSSGVTIDRNVIGNSFLGIYLDNTDYSTIIGNQIGFHSLVSGVHTGNKDGGIFVTNGSANNTVASNFISRTGLDAAGQIVGAQVAAIRVSGDGTDSNTFTSNTIYNNGGDGITIDNLAAGNWVGSTIGSLENTITNNWGYGVHILSTQAHWQALNRATTNNSVFENTIYGNNIGAPGIASRAVELSFIDASNSGYGTTAQQDKFDSDYGTNNLINSLDALDGVNTPTWSATRANNGFTVAGTYSGAPNTFFRIDYYSYTGSADSPQLERFLMSVTGTVNALGEAVLDNSFSGMTIPAEHTHVTAIVTQLENVNGIAVFRSSSRASLGVALQNPSAVLFNAGTAVEDTVIRFNGGTNPSLSISDPLGVGGPFSLELTTTIGKLDPDPTSGSPSFSITLNGTIAQINSALQNLVLITPLNFNGSVTLNYLLLGNGNALMDLGEAIVDVAAVNDPPTLTGSIQTVVQGTGLTIRPDMLLIQDDVLPIAIASFRLGLAPTLGQLLFNGTVLQAGAIIQADDLLNQAITYVNATGGLDSQDKIQLFATDAQGLESVLPAEILFNITANAANTPTIDTTNTQIVFAENAAFSTTLRVIPAAGVSVSSVTLSGSDASLFSIDSSDLNAVRIWLNGQANFELQPNYSIQVNVLDAYGLGTSRVINLSVVDVDEAPVLLSSGIPSQPGSFFEDTPFKLATANAITLTISEPDLQVPFNQAVVYLTVINGTVIPAPTGVTVTTLASGPNGITSLSASGDAGGLNVFLRELQLVGLPNFHGNLTLKVGYGRIGDPAATVPTQTFNFSLAAINDPPSLDPIAFTAVEAQATRLVINRSSFVDADQSGNQFSFVLTTLPQSAQLFRTNGQALAIGESFSYADVLAGNILYKANIASPRTTSFDLTIVDAWGLAGNTASVSVTVLPNPAVFPSITAPSSLRVEENQTGSWTFRYTVDPAAGPATLTLTGADSDRFTLTDLGSGQAVLELTRAANFEARESSAANNQFDLGVAIFDALGRANEIVVSVQVVDVNEVASLRGQVGATLLEDNSIALGTKANRVVLDDPDASDNLQTLTITASQSWFSNTVSTLPGFTELSRNSEGVTRFVLTGSATQLQIALDQLVLQPKSQFSGNANLTIELQDSSLTLKNQVVILNLDLKIDAVNDLPTLLITPLSLTENTSLTLRASQLQASDVEDALLNLNYELVKGPSLGELLLNGQPLAVGGRFSQAQLESGALTYANRSLAANTDTVEFSVVDSAGAKSSPANLTLNINRATTIAPAPTPAPVVTPTPVILPIVTVDVPDPITTVKAPPANPVSVGDANGPKGSGPKNNANTEDNTRVNSTPAPANQSENASKDGQRGAQQTELILSAQTGQTNVPITRVAIDTSGSAINPSRWSQLKSEKLQQDTVLISQSLKTPAFQTDIEQMRGEVNRGLELERTIVNSTVAVSTGVSIGYVIWLLRGGVLLSSLIASLPAWRAFDPLPILANTSKNKSESEDDSLENLLKKARQKWIKNPELAPTKQGSHDAETLS
jgi:parallel beta-helix repeat protein